MVTIDAGIGGVSYVWSDGTTGSTLTTTSTGSYSLTVSNACGTDSDTVIVDISGQAPDMALGPDTTLCAAETLVLSVMADAETIVTWQDNTVGTNYLVTAPGTYAVRASNRCGTDADSIDVEYINPPGPFTLGPDTVLCPGQSVILVAPATPDEIEWQDGSTDATYVADREGTYVLRVSNRCGIAVDSLAVFVLADEPMVDLGPERMWCPGDTFLLDATQPFPAQYRWNTGATTPTLLTMEPGVYRVDVSTPCVTAEGMTAIDEEADCFPAPEIYVPNVFSPNGDGINDVFTVITHGEAEILGMEGTIFDRWGNMVHRASANPFTWDGRFHDDAMDPAVFVYMITVRYRINGSEFEVSLAGDVTLIR
jgi:gliding motility-associated-like protein